MLMQLRIVHVCCVSAVANWILGCILIYASLFGIGAIIFKDWRSGVLYIVAAIIAAVLISRNLSNTEWQPLAAETTASTLPEPGLDDNQSVRGGESVARS